jgi:hypothetical protein
MAPRKIGRPKAVKPMHPITSLRGSREFQRWLEGFAKHERDTYASLIEKALVHYAKARGYEPEAPER